MVKKKGAKVDRERKFTSASLCPNSVLMLRTLTQKPVFPLQTSSYGFISLIKKEQRDLTAVPWEQLQAYGFGA